jgi:hypothetical protein
MENNFPRIEVISIMSTAKNLALKALHLVGDSIRHEGISDHDKSPWVDESPVLDEAGVEALFNVPDHFPLRRDVDLTVPGFEHRPKGW